jgi:hypothetical protein
MLLMAALVLLLMRQIMPIAAGLASGIALSSFGSVSRSLAWARPGKGRLRELAVAGTRMLSSSYCSDIDHTATVSQRGATTRNPEENSIGRDL